MKRTFKGKVISNRMQKSVTVSVDEKKEHPLYRKKFVYTKKFMADNQIGAEKGDFVVIEEVAPISKSKKWKVTKKITEKEAGEE